MSYANETFYKSEYLLGRNPVINTGFPFYARQASVTIDRYTFSRLKNISDDEIPEPVMMCCCELAEQLYRKEKREADTGGKISEKVGTYSASFSTASEYALTDANQERDTIAKWLSNTGLCYKGV